MKKNAIKTISLLLVAFLGASCSTTYDAYGNPTQSVDPVLATAGIAAAGLIGYTASKNRYKDGYKDNRYANPRRPDYHRRPVRRPHHSPNYRHGGNYRGYR